MPVGDAIEVRDIDTLEAGAWLDQETGLALQVRDGQVVYFAMTQPRTLVKLAEEADVTSALALRTKAIDYQRSHS